MLMDIKRAHTHDTQQRTMQSFFSEAGYCRDASVLVAILFAKTELGAAVFTNGEA